jgi:hypothetical protein
VLLFNYYLTINNKPVIIFNTMRSLLFILCLPLLTVAQTVTIRNGIVYVDNNAFCSYVEAGERIKTLPFAGGGFSQMLTPEETDIPFKDVIIKNLQGEPLIFVTAKVLSSPSNIYLEYYYKIEFVGYDTLLHVPFRPNFFEGLINSIAAYDVITNGSLSKLGIDSMIQFWNRKPYAFSTKVFQHASICNYNASPYTVENSKYNDSSYISIRGNRVYLHDTLYGYYHISKGILATALPGNSKNSFYYFIESADKIPIAEFQVNKRYAEILFWPEGYKTPLRLYTAVRDEKHLIWEVVNVLVNEKSYNPATGNNK